MGEPQDSEVAEPQPLVQSAPPEAPAAPRAARTGTGVLATLLALAALILAGFATWRIVTLERGQGDTASALREDVNRRMQDAERTADQRKRELDSMRARLAVLAREHAFTQVALARSAAPRDLIAAAAAALARHRI